MPQTLGVWSEFGRVCCLRLFFSGANVDDFCGFKLWGVGANVVGNWASTGGFFELIWWGLLPTNVGCWSAFMDGMCGANYGGVLERMWLNSWSEFGGAFCLKLWGFPATLAPALLPQTLGFWSEFGGVFLPHIWWVWSQV